jgi:hypothetical protein
MKLNPPKNTSSSQQTWNYAAHIHFYDLLETQSNFSKYIPIIYWKRISLNTNGQNPKS